MNLIIAITIFTLLEAYRNYYIIEHKKKSPHTIYTYLLRCLGIIACVGYFPHSFEYFWLNLISSMLIFWFVFDYSLNLMRAKPFFYLSNRGIDKYQVGFFAFWCKLMLAIAAIQAILKPELILQ